MLVLAYEFNKMGLTQEEYENVEWLHLAVNRTLFTAK
jgi:hypothetical protein